MNFSAAASRSAVVTPGRSLLSTRARVFTRISPAAAILSISSGVFLMITRGSQLVFQAQCCHGSADVIVDLSLVPAPVEATQEALLLVVVDDRLGLVVVDVEPVLDRVGLVVVALDETGSVLIADAFVLRPGDGRAPGDHRLRRRVRGLSAHLPRPGLRAAGAAP